MQTLKFRAWHKENKFMFDVRFLNLEDKLVDHSQFSFDEIELMQWAGFQDKNGIDVYPCDIVKIEYESGNLFGVVEENIPDYGTRLDPINKKAWPTQWIIYPSTVNIHGSVIGNIYENPELLKP